MIFTESTIKISNNVSKMDSTIVLYRGDKNVEIRFTILQSPFKYSNTVATNVIESTNASYGQLVIKTPNDKPPIFSEVSATKEGTVLFTITKEMIDEIEEVGVYTFQIRLMDENKQSRVTIPPVENGIEIKEPIAIEDDNTTNVVGLAKANYAVATSSDIDTPTFDDNGKYNKTNWNDGDIITNVSLNKIEDGIYTTNENVTATKKYVDDNAVILPLPIHTIQETTAIVIKVVNIMDLVDGVTYSTHKDPNETRRQSYRVAYVCDDGSFKIICTLSLANKIVHLLKIIHFAKNNYSTLSDNNTVYTVNYSKHSTNTDVEVTKTLQYYLPIANTTEYNPTKEYHPATKKYVDDRFVCTDLMENVGTIPKEEMQKCNNGTSRYVSSINFKEFFADYKYCVYQGTYGDKNILMKYDAEYNRILAYNLDTVDTYDIMLGFDFDTNYMYPFNGGAAQVKSYQFTNDLVIVKNDILNPSEVLTKNNTHEYTPTNDYHPATKKYVDDKITVKILPVDYNKNCATNVADLEPHSIYMSPNDAKFLYLAYEKLSGSLVGFLFTAKAHGRFIYTGVKDDTKIEIMIEGSCYTVYFKTDTVDAHVEKTVYYLTKNNTTEFTPTTDYEPATKKYVDDIKTGIDGIKADLGTAQLTTNAKDVKGAVNEVNAQCKDIVNNKADLQKVKELIVDAQLKGTEIDTSTFIRKSQLNDISLISENMANAEKFLTDKKIITWKDTQTRDNCIDSVAAPGWIVFNEIECNAGDILFLLHGTTKLLGIANVFLGDGTISRVESVSEVSGITIQENEKYIRICYNNDTNKDLNLFQIKKSTSNLDKFDKFGNIPIVTKEEKANINAKLNDLDIEISRLLRTDIEITTTIGLYNTLTKEEQFNDNNKYIKAKISVQGGEVLYIGATNVNNYNFKPYIILDAENNIIASCEDYENNTVLKDLKVEVPVNGCTMCLNSLAENGIRVAKYTKEKIDNIEMQVNKNKNDMSFINSNYENDIKRYKRMQLKHPFKYKTFDKAYITFCFDDGTNDCDKIASIFKEFGYPMCLSLPPDSLNTVCIGLQSASNGFTVNMKVREVANKVIENGGEVLCHSWTPITKDNITNKDLLVETFVTNVKVLRDAGFEVNGIMTAGGTGALDGGLEQGGDILQYWASIEFDYSDRYGFTEDYFYPRMNLGDSLDMNKTRIDDVVNHNKWIVFFGHALQDTGNYTEENLRAILQYCKDRNVTVVTYKHIYNTFK